MRKIKKVLENNIFIWSLVQIFKKDYHGYLREYQIAKQIAPHLNIFWNYIRWIYTLIIYGASASDYFVYEFYKKSMYEINTYVTRRRRFWFMKILNNGTNRQPVEDKVLFANTFSKFTNRKIVDGNEMTYEEFKTFLAKENKLIVKPRYGFDGKNIFVVEDSLNEENLRKIYDDIHGRNFVVEEIVKQTGVLHELNPGTVNTIRVNVLHWKDECFVVNALLRVGRGNGCVDNLHSGGVEAAIDMESGVVGYWGGCLDMRFYMFHPVSGKQILGITIPRWNEVLETAKKAAMIIDDVPYTSWDIVASEEKVTIIEGNTYGNTKGQQISDHIGKWRVYKSFTDKVIAERKQVNKRRGRAIER